MNTMTNSRDIIIKIKEVRDEKGYSLNDVTKKLEEKGYFISKTTLSRIFAEGSEDIKFRFEDTIKPIANVLLDIDTVDDTDDLDVQAMKSLLKYKNQIIESLEREINELKSALDKSKIKTHEKLDSQREQYEKELKQANETIMLLREQLAYKDKRMDEFMNTLKEKDNQLAGMLNHIMNCPYRAKGGVEDEG